MLKLLSLFLLISTYCFSVERLPYCDPAAALNCAKKYLPDNPIVIECGACEGFDTVNMATLWPKGIIHSFEPIPEFFDILTQKTNHFPNVHRYKIALGDSCKKSQFYLSKYENGNMAAASSLLPPSEELRNNGWMFFKDSIEVEVLALDSFAVIYHVCFPDFFWLDMQGYELNMLQASEVAKRAKVIYIEVEFKQLYEGQYLYKDILKWMNENHFDLVALDCDPETQPDFGNAVFVNRNR